MTWEKLGEFQKNELRWVTIIFGGIRFSEFDDPRKIANEAADMVGEFRKKWIFAARYKRAWKGLTWAGEYEIDVVRGKLNKPKIDLLGKLGADVSPLAVNERIVVPHIHFVVGGSETILKSAKKSMEYHWLGPRRTKVMNLHKDQSVCEALSCLRGYCTKRRYQYSSGGWQGLPDSRVMFGKRWEAWVVDVVDEFYSIIDIDNMFSGSFTS